MINFALQLDKEQDLLKGTVKKSITRKYNLSKENKVLDDFYVKKYDQKGNRTETEYLTPNGDLKFKQIATFLNGYKSGYKNYDINGKIKSEGHFELDNVGNITARFHNGNCEEQYLLDNNGRIIEVKYLLTGSVEKFEYGKNNLVVKQISQSNSSFGSNIKKLTIYQNDEFGNILKYSTYNADTGNLIMTGESKINKEGDEIENTLISPNGSILSKNMKAYTYDNNGNWIELYNLNDDQKAYNMITREILYY